MPNPLVHLIAPRFGEALAKIFQPATTLVPFEDADFILSEKPLARQVLGSRRVSFVNLRLDPLVCHGLGFEPDPNLHDQFSLSLRWNGECWDNQLLISFPVRGLLDDNRGPQVEVGTGGRFVDQSHLLSLFEGHKMREFLQETKHLGFVTLGLVAGRDSSVVGSSDIRHRVVSVRLGLPGLMTLAAHMFLKGGGLGFYITSPGEIPAKLFETWVLGGLLSEWPWPMERGSRGPIDHHSTAAKPDSDYLKSESESTPPLVSVWNSSLTRAEGMLRSRLRAEAGRVGTSAQYRTDVGMEVRLGWRLAAAVV